MNREAIDAIAQTVTEFESAVGIPPGFITDLFWQDDWSFFIKATALVEASLTQLLAERTGEDATTDLFRRLPLGDRGYGKVRFARALKLISDGQQKFIDLMVEIRNRLAHGVQNVNFDVGTYYRSLDQNQRKKFLNAVSFAFTVSDETTLAGFVESLPKEATYFALLQLVFALSGYEQPELEISRLANGREHLGLSAV